MKIPTARDWMTQDFLALSPEDEIFGATDKLLASGFAAAPVIDDDGSLAGMFTEKDAIRALSHLLYTETATGATVGRHLSTNVTACDPDMDLFRVSEAFLSCNFPALPVVERGRVVGIVRRQAQLRCMREYRRSLEREREKQARAAGRQADRPRGIEALQQAAGRATREQLVRLLGRRSS